MAIINPKTISKTKDNVLAEFRRLFLRVPERMNWKTSAVSGALSGATAAGLAALISAPGTRLRNSAIAGALFGAGGAYAPIVAQNYRERLGGYWKKGENPDYYNPDIFLKSIDPNKPVTIYVHGAANDRYGMGRSSAHTKNSVKENIFEFTHGDADRIPDLVNRLPKNVRVNFVGHSMGGGALEKILPKVTHKINNVHFLDPVDTNPVTNVFNRLWHLLGLAPRYSAAGRRKLHSAAKYDGDPSNIGHWLPWLPGFRQTGDSLNIPAEDVLHVPDNHGLNNYLLRHTGAGMSGDDLRWLSALADAKDLRLTTQLLYEPR